MIAAFAILIDMLLFLGLSYLIGGWYVNGVPPSKSPEGYPPKSEAAWVMLCVCVFMLTINAIAWATMIMREPS